jgi:hypothetical protein
MSVIIYSKVQVLGLLFLQVVNNFYPLITEFGGPFVCNFVVYN